VVVKTNAILIAILAGALLTSAVGFGGAAETSQDPHRVVMHVNSGDEKVQRGALNNIRHLYQELGREHVRVELVAHGAGLTLLTKKRFDFGHRTGATEDRLWRRVHGLLQYDEGDESHCARSGRAGGSNGSCHCSIDGVARARLGLHQTVVLR
jgi:hypothetical protein